MPLSSKSPSSPSLLLVGEGAGGWGVLRQTLRFELLERGAGRFLGGGAFAPPDSAADERLPNRHFHAKLLGVLGSLSAGDAVIGRDVEAGLYALLKFAARVDVQTVCDDVIQQLKQGRHDKIDDRVHALIEVDGADDGFEGAAEYGETFAARR